MGTLRKVLQHQRVAQNNRQQGVSTLLREPIPSGETNTHGSLDESKLAQRKQDEPDRVEFEFQSAAGKHARRPTGHNQKRRANAELDSHTGLFGEEVPDRSVREQKERAAQESNLAQERLAQLRRSRDDREADAGRQEGLLAVASRRQNVQLGQTEQRDQSGRVERLGRKAADKVGQTGHEKELRMRQHTNQEITAREQEHAFGGGSEFEKAEIHERSPPHEDGTRSIHFLNGAQISYL